MQPPSLTVQKLWWKLKTTDKQTNRTKQYTPDHSIRGGGHKKAAERISSFYTLMHHYYFIEYSSNIFSAYLQLQTCGVEGRGVVIYLCSSPSSEDRSGVAWNSLFNNPAVSFRSAWKEIQAIVGNKFVTFNDRLRSLCAKNIFFLQTTCTVLRKCTVLNNVPSFLTGNLFYANLCFFS